MSTDTKFVHVLPGGSLRERIAARLRPALARRRGHVFVACAIALASVAAMVITFAQTSPPDLPPTTLSNAPLMAVPQGDKPAMVLALSVEYPTVGAQYMPAGATDSKPILNDTSYSNQTEYIGYYDADSCYTYKNDPAETPPANMGKQDMKRFDRTGPATDRMCADGFSGNFLNWATGSAVDMMRMALSGGDRYIDTDKMTILQRAVLPDGSQSPVPCFFNSRNFPAKKLDRDGGGDKNFYGAIPVSMRTQAGDRNVWVGNMLNRIYFGAYPVASTPPADCSARSAYTLGGPVPPSNPPSGGAGPYVIQPPGTELPALNVGDKEVVCKDKTTGCDVPWNAASGQVYQVWYGSGTNWSVATINQWFNCNSATFGNPGGSGPNACYLRFLPGLTSEGYFFSRVQVCDLKSDDSLADERDYGLCAKQPGGNYKPVGAIQKYSEKVRLAAFGYVIDQTNPASDADSSFGGVLRVPMKYVGDRIYNDVGSDIGANDKREWDAVTGVFLANPESHAMGTSGVINYLNKFGRTSSTPGRYKKFDPVAELHYESIRYLQGKQPSKLAIDRVKADPAKADGFPVYTTWDDPFGGTRSATADYSCLRASVVVVGDINTNDPSRDRFNLSTVDGAVNGTTVPDITAWNGWRGVALGFERNDTGMTYSDSAGIVRNVGRTPVAGLDPVNTVARNSPLVGTAYWARSHDIRPAGTTLARKGLRVRSLFFDVNEWGESGGAAKANFRRMENQFFTAAKYGGYEVDPKQGNSWGNPFKNEDGTDNENVWQRPDAPGEAKTYYLAEDARKVLKAFDDIFKTASTAARSIAGTAVSSGELTVTGTYAYQGAFNTEDWSGDVLAFHLGVDALGAVQIATTPTWQASALLNAMANPVADRHIFVGPVGTSSATAFTWDAIDPVLRDRLALGSPTAAPDALGQARLAWLRGDRSKEGTTFRQRSSLLGDVVNSGVVYLGAPSTSLMADPDFPKFHKDHANRIPAVFAGANDGMLHAFNANTGEELFGYIPSWLSGAISYLPSPGYQKRPYVDASPAVGEARLEKGWRSVLVSGSGGGGRGVFALDVTDATNFSADKLLWEFTSANDPDLGYVLGKPQVVKLRVNASTEAVPQYKWFAMVASGVNNYVADEAGNASATGKPALFILSLDKQPATPWCRFQSSTPCGTPNYYRISFPFTGQVATGLVNFRPIFGGDRQVTAVYAGDLQGNLWKLDFALHGQEDWSLDKLSAFNDGNEAHPLPLYIAKDAGGHRQPITMAPSVASGPVYNGARTTYVAFGTGKYLEVADVNSAAQNSFYVVFDPGRNQRDDANGASAVSGRERLAAGTVTASAVTIPPFSWGFPARDDDLSRRAGYYFDYATPGERSISNAVIQGNNLVFGSLSPQSGASEPCGQRKGGNQYALNLDSGNGTVLASDVGLLGEPLVLNLAGATTYEKSDTTGRRVKTIVGEVLQQGSAGLGSGGTVTTTLVAGRLSWRQIHNYEEGRRSP